MVLHSNRCEMVKAENLHQLVVLPDIGGVGALMLTRICSSGICRISSGGVLGILEGLGGEGAARS